MLLEWRCRWDLPSVSQTNQMRTSSVTCGCGSATRGSRCLRLIELLLMAVCWCGAAGTAGAQVLLQTIYTSAAAQGVVPFSGLVEAPDGYFYGTVPASTLTGNYGSGVRLSRSGVVTVLVHFTGPNGKDPEGGLVLANDGNLYGTTFSGGANSLGVLFRFSLPAGVFQLLHSFTITEGPGPSYTLIQASDGFLYGVTAGTSTNPATIFRATTAGAVTVLTNFPSGLSPTSPADGLVEGPDGWLYGTATIHSFSSPGPIGSIYKVATNGAYQTLATFSDGLSQPLHGDGPRPIGGLALGPDGLLYGTIGHNVSPLISTDGSVFKMTTNGLRTTIATFNGTNGSDPMTRLTLANDGAFYGFAGSLFRVTTNGTLTAIVTNGFGAYGIQRGLPRCLRPLTAISTARA